MNPSFHQPIVGLDDEQIGAGWRRVSVGETVKTYFESYLLIPRAHWQLTSFWSKDNQKVTGRTHYRSPASLSAWLSLVRPLARKWYQRFTNKTPSS